MANRLHVRTRPEVIERELLFKAGRPYDSVLVAESARNLRGMGIFRDVRIDSIPTDTGVVMRVTTRDGWTTKAGLRFSTGSHAVDETQIVEFARAFDPQPFHLDHEAARGSIFQGLAASGWHTAALTMRLLVTGGPRFGWGFIGAGGEVSWPRPAYAGDRLTLHAEIIELTPSRSKQDRGIARVRLVMKNQRDEVVQDMVARVLVPRRPAG